MKLVCLIVRTYGLSAESSKLSLPQRLQAGHEYAVLSSTPTTTPADRNKTIRSDGGGTFMHAAQLCKTLVSVFNRFFFIS